LFRLFKKRIDEVKEKASTSSMTDVFSDEKGQRIKLSKIKDILWDLETSLLESDVAASVVEEIMSSIRDELAEKRLKKGVDLGDAIEIAVKHAVRKALTANPLDFKGFIVEHEKPVVIMFVGVNGTGKTTAIAKIAYMLQKEGISTVLAAADTFRAGAIEQLQLHADRLGVRLIKHRHGADPAAVAFDAIDHAKARKRDVVLVDTAGRMQTNKNLMDEMRKIRRVASPDLVLFVGDALAGNDVVEQAVSFNEAVEIDGAILTKIDADAKGGAALSIAHAVGKPVLFVSTGQEYPQFEAFDADWMVERLFE